MKTLSEDRLRARNTRSATSPISIGLLTTHTAPSLRAAADDIRCAIRGHHHHTAVRRQPRMAASSCRPFESGSR